MKSSNQRFREGPDFKGCGKTQALAFALKGRGFSRTVGAGKSIAALAAEGQRTNTPVWPTTGRPARRLIHALILTAAVFLFMGAGDDSARFKDLGHRMMCACGCSQILLECNHVGCTYSDKMRDQLQAAIDRGNNDDLILQGFVQDYGPTVIAAPTATGFNRVAWIMPFAALAFGISFVVYVVRSWKNRPPPALADGIIIRRGNDDEFDEFRRKARKETDL